MTLTLELQSTHNTLQYHPNTLPILLWGWGRFVTGIRPRGIKNLEVPGMRYFVMVSVDVKHHVYLLTGMRRRLGLKRRFSGVCWPPRRTPEPRCLPVDTRTTLLTSGRWPCAASWVTSQNKCLTRRSSPAPPPAPTPIQNTHLADPFRTLEIRLDYAATSLSPYIYNISGILERPFSREPQARTFHDQAQ